MRFRVIGPLVLFGFVGLNATAQSLEIKEIKKGASDAEVAAWVRVIQQHGGRLMLRVVDSDVADSQILDLAHDSLSDLMDRLRSRKDRVRARSQRIHSGLKRRGHLAGEMFEIAPIVSARFARSSSVEMAREARGFLAQPDVEALEADLPVLMPPSEAGGVGDVVGGALAQSVPWGISRVRAPEAWVLGSGRTKGAGVKVAVMDSGGSVGHPDLNYVGGYSGVTRTTTQADWADSISSCRGHGTHIAGTVAALDNSDGVVGVAPEAQLYAISVFEDMGGSCLAYTTSQIVGLNWAVSQGIRVVNVSIGSAGSSYSYALAIANAATAGTYLVAAAGNNGGSSLLYPGSDANAFGVGAVNGSNTKSSYSNTGDTLDIVAPGDGIDSTMPGGGYGGKSGTSMATPHVVGTIALMLQVRPNLTFQQIMDIFSATSSDLGTPGRDPSYGVGLVNAEAAVSMAITGGAPPVEPTLAVAESDLLSGSGLSVSERAVLDQRGNNNGTFDLGDVLARKNRG